MKKLLMLTAIFALLFQTVAASAATPDFSGAWELDKTKSVLPETMQIESMTLLVSQTTAELRVQTTAKRSPNGMGNGGGMGGMRGGAGNGAGGGMRGMGGGQTIVYSLDGKETSSDIGNDVTMGKETKTAKMSADGKLNLTVVRNLESQMGSMTMTTSDVWELLDGGKTLKITRSSQTPRGVFDSILYFTKASVRIGTTDATVKDSSGDATAARQINGGVLNGKAVTLAKPVYPPAARAVKAEGAVNVQVTIDEQGNIASASAVSGHPLLRQAAEEAARASKFAPTLLEGVPVRVTGIITYVFTP